jgi:hypothetical protein
MSSKTLQEYDKPIDKRPSRAYELGFEMRISLW